MLVSHWGPISNLEFEPEVQSRRIQSERNKVIKTWMVFVLAFAGMVMGALDSLF
jgi:hypothetical protein